MQSNSSGVSLENKNIKPDMSPLNVFCLKR